MPVDRIDKIVRELKSIFLWMLLVQFLKHLCHQNINFSQSECFCLTILYQYLHFTKVMPTYMASLRWSKRKSLCYDFRRLTSVDSLRNVTTVSVDNITNARLIVPGKIKKLTWHYNVTLNWVLINLLLAVLSLRS